MNKQDNRNKNLKVGVILGLLFVGLFTATTLVFVVGFEASLSSKKTCFRNNNNYRRSYRHLPYRSSHR